MPGRKGIRYWNTLVIGAGSFVCLRVQEYVRQSGPATVNVFWDRSCLRQCHGPSLPEGGGVQQCEEEEELPRTSWDGILCVGSSPVLRSGVWAPNMGPLASYWDSEDP